MLTVRDAANELIRDDTYRLGHLVSLQELFHGQTLPLVRIRCLLQVASQVHDDLLDHLDFVYQMKLVLDVIALMKGILQSRHCKIICGW